MTLKNIAAMAGVSVSTVSRILNDKNTKSASPEVKERVWQVVRETGYVPNEQARNLRSQSRTASGTRKENKKYFACVYARNADSNDLFFGELAHAIEYTAYKRGYILKCSFYANEMEEKSFSSMLKEQEISGLAVLGRFENDRAAEIIKNQRNVVHVGLNPVSVAQDFVFCDGKAASKLAVETLLSLGHSKIAYIGETVREIRFLGYKETLAENDIPYQDKRVIRSQQTLMGGFDGAAALLRGGTDVSAIFCANDATAMGCIKYLREQKIRVPEQMSVISIDDVEMSRYFMPMLTTIHVPIQELGKQAANMLIDRIENGHILPVRMELPFSLSNRDSCAKNTKG